MMTLDEYQMAAARTECDYSAALAFGKKFSISQWRLVHAAVGLATEVFELLSPSDDVNVLEELGDCAYYVVTGLSALGESDMGIRMEPQVLWKPKLARPRLIEVSGSLLDRVVKKAMFSGRPADEAQSQYNLRVAWNAINSLAYYQGLTMDLVLTANVDKLMKRHTRGFSAGSCAGRDTRVERETLERAVGKVG